MYIMTDVKVSDLRQNLPSYLARARGGERIRVTSRGEVIAEISGPKSSSESVESLRKHLRGLVEYFGYVTEPVYPPEEWDANK